MGYREISRFKLEPNSTIPTSSSSSSTLAPSSSSSSFSSDDSDYSNTITPTTKRSLFDRIFHRTPSAQCRSYPPPEQPPPTALPAGYLDPPFKGMGLVLDFGWKRSEQGMLWEVEDWRRRGAGRGKERGDGGGEGEKEEVGDGDVKRDEGLWRGLSFFRDW